MYISSRWLFLLYILNGFFKRMLKLFPFLPISHAFILESFFSLEYHIFKYLSEGVYCQNHVDNNIVLLGCLFFEHYLSCVLMKVAINFMFNGIIDEITINDGTIFVCFSMTSFTTIFISCTTKLCQNSFHNYLFFVLKFIVQVFLIPMATLLRMS